MTVVFIFDADTVLELHWQNTSLITTQANEDRHRLLM